MNSFIFESCKLKYPFTKSISSDVSKFSSLDFSITCSNSSIDRGAKQIKELLPKICKAAEYENSIFSLAKALEKTQKLLNALENVIIPQYQHKIRFILATLEEREREEFAKLKKVKAKMESRDNG